MMIRLDRSHETIVAVCACGARAGETRRNAARLDAWVTAHAAQHEATADRARAVAASQTRTRRHAGFAPVERKT